VAVSWWPSDLFWRWSSGGAVDLRQAVDSEGRKDGGDNEVSW
jgi:hypothetical protein